MEELLNKLIEKGWKPFGINYYCYFNIRERIEIIGGPFGGGEYILEKTPSLRELVSKESGLWQFVCENGMVKRKRCGTNWEGENVCYNYQDYEYWLICSALCDEDKLEQFLLDNIKIEGNENIHDMTTTMKKK